MLRTRQFLRHLSAEGRNRSFSVGVRKQAGFDKRVLELFSPFPCRILGSIAIDSGMESARGRRGRSHRMALGGFLRTRCPAPQHHGFGRPVSKNRDLRHRCPSGTLDPRPRFPPGDKELGKRRVVLRGRVLLRTRRPTIENSSGRVQQQAAPPFFMTTCLPAVSVTHHPLSSRADNASRAALDKVLQRRCVRLS